MDIIKVSVDDTLREIYKRMPHEPADCYFAVDPNHPELCSVNGDIYSKDMTTLRLIAPCHYKKSYTMLPIVKEVSVGTAFGFFENIVLSSNLEKISLWSFEYRQKLDLRKTKIRYIDDMPETIIQHIMGGILRLPSGTISTRTIDLNINEHELIKRDPTTLEVILIALVDFNAKEYSVSENVDTVQIDNIQDLHNLKTIHLSSSVKNLDSMMFHSRKDIKFTVDKNNPFLFFYEGCLYQRMDDGNAYTLLWIPQDATKIHILEGTKVIGNFAGCNIKFEEITFPKSLQKIKISAFRNSSMPEINLFHTQTEAILEHAFDGVKTKKIYLSPKTMHIKDYAFASSVFEDINIQDTKIQNLSQYAFSHAMFGKMILPPTLQCCCHHAFYKVIAEEVDCSQTKCEDISGGTFADSTIPVIKLPTDLKYIGSNAFCKSAVQELVVESKYPLYIYAEAFANSKIRKFKALSVTEIRERAFYGCECLEELILPEECNICSSAVFKCSKTIKAIVQKIKPLF